MSGEEGYAHNVVLAGNYDITEDYIVGMSMDMLFIEDPKSSASLSLKIDFAYVF
jgi:hypothetical protein